ARAEAADHLAKIGTPGPGEPDGGQDEGGEQKHFEEPPPEPATPAFQVVIALKRRGCSNGALGGERGGQRRPGGLPIPLLAPRRARALWGEHRERRAPLGKPLTPE